MTVLEPVREYIAAQTKAGKRRITLEKLLRKTGLPRRPALRVCDKLAAEGYLEEVANNPKPLDFGEMGPPRRNPTWKIVKDKDVSERPAAKPHKNTDRDKIYRIIRARRKFTRSELAILTDASDSNVDTYTRILERHGIIRRIGKQDGEIRFLLVKDPGPARPRFQEVAS